MQNNIAEYDESSTGPLIVITGANGELGRAIVTELLRRVPAVRVGVSVRNPDRADALRALGVRVRGGDFAARAGLARAFEGAAVLLLVSSNAGAYGGDPLAQHRAAIDAAQAAGVGRIVYTSHMGASLTSAFPPMRDHAATELMLRNSGLRWTALRNGFYASSGLALMGDALTSGTFDAPQDGAVSWTTHADLAEAAVRILTDAAQVDGPTPPLTGSQALDLSGLASIASELRGQPVTRHSVSDDAFRTRMLARSAPAGVIGMMLGLYAASRAGEFAAVDPALATLLGRSPRSMRDVIATQLRRTDAIHSEATA